MSGAHWCDPPDEDSPGPDRWTCPDCGQAWFLHRMQWDDGVPNNVWLETEERCDSCERCTWNPGPDCGKPDHPHCPICGHCTYRHTQQTAVTGLSA